MTVDDKRCPICYDDFDENNLLEIQIQQMNVENENKNDEAKTERKDESKNENTNQESNNNDNRNDTANDNSNDNNNTNVNGTENSVKPVVNGDREVKMNESVSNNTSINNNETKCNGIKPKPNMDNNNNVVSKPSNDANNDNEPITPNGDVSKTVVVNGDNAVANGDNTDVVMHDSDIKKSTQNGNSDINRNNADESSHIIVTKGNVDTNHNNNNNINTNNSNNNIKNAIANKPIDNNSNIDTNANNDETKRNTDTNANNINTESKDNTDVTMANNFDDIKTSNNNNDTNANDDNKESKDNNGDIKMDNNDNNDDNKESKEAKEPEFDPKLINNETIVYLSKCQNANQHYFHAGCIMKWLDQTGKCSHCGTRYAVQTGNQPPGLFLYRKYNNLHCHGHEKVGTWVMTMKFEAGYQTKDHPNPGVRYPGDTRIAYVPDTQDGRQALMLSKIAFDRKLVFTVGHSLTSKQDNRIIWNGLHFKTSINADKEHHGWKNDFDYFKRFKDELKTKGITVNDLTDDHVKFIKGQKIFIH